MGITPEREISFRIGEILASTTSYAPGTIPSGTGSRRSQAVVEKLLVPLLLQGRDELRLYLLVGRRFAGASLY